MRLWIVGTLSVFAALAGPAWAQHTLNYPVGQSLPYALDSGVLDNPADAPASVYAAVVYVEKAAWVRLYFKTATLAPGSRVRLTSALDGDVQELDAAGLEMWSNTSAYLNGEVVFLDLIAAGHSAHNLVVLDHVAVAYASEGHTDTSCGICGNDDRFPSNETWSGRLMPVGCTASVFNENSCLVSAGHCAGSNLVVQFNVPASQANCNPVNPPTADQFPITQYQFQNAGVGADWSVMKTGANNLGQTAYERYGHLQPISTVVGNPGDIGNVWGYGIDDQCTRSQTQQYSTGPIQSRTSTYYTFSVDITYGNSGSALLTNGAIIGIVTHCTNNCPDYATRIDLPAFANARNSLCPLVTGACCVSGACIASQTQSQCNAQGGTWYANQSCAQVQCSVPTLMGDLNCDGVVTFDDIDPFVLGLADPGAYQGQYPNCNLLNGDLNCDGVVDFSDVNSFVDCVGTSDCTCH